MKIPKNILFSIAPMMILCVPFTARAEDALIGTKAKKWQFSDWQNSKPLALNDLTGKVVLVRWWTAPACPFCKATAPALNEFHKKYKEKGLTVLGIYHHKSRSAFKPGQVKGWAKDFGFQFPVAVDPKWQTLRQWWLTPGRRRWTSVSFLIDRKGVIRHIHPGGQYVKGDDDYKAMQQKIEELLAAK